MEATERKQIGKYKITGILGRGGMGIVYRGEDDRIGRQVAIKTLTEGYTGQPEMLKMFYREAKAGFLQHPNIVIVYDMGDEDGMPFIVMEYAEGEPLNKILRAGTPLPLIDKLTVIDQVCLALGYAHQQGVIHRDIKPANVMVRREPTIHAKLLDFGIAKVQGAKDLTKLTKTGDVLGTLHYVAPERLKGLPGDGRGDLFATGVMLYQVLTGKLPFEGEEEAAVLQKILYEPCPPLSNYLSGYPPVLDGILSRALAKDPDLRYGTAEEFSADLRSLIEILKKAQVTEFYSDAERLSAAQQYGQARDLLNQLVRIDPQHTSARRLLTEVNQNIAKLRRAEQVRNLIAEADGALESARFLDALSRLEEAAKIDAESGEVRAKIEEVRAKKQRYEEIESHMTRAESLRSRGDLTGALSEVERVLRLNDHDTRARSIHNEISRQIRIAAQQEQLRQLLGQAKTEMTAGRYTDAIKMLRSAEGIDPESAEAHSLLQSAITAQEQERRRKVLEQIHQEIGRCIDAEEWERAADLLERSLEKLPTETTLLQLKTKVALQLKRVRLKQQIDAATTRAQETFQQSPAEALLIVQKAIQELGSDERLLALETSLRERMQAAEKEQIRNRYLKDAQEAIDRNDYAKAIEILESYQYEFSDAAGVEDLLEMARNEVTQQQRRERVAACSSQAKALMENEQYTKAIRVLEPVCAATNDSSLLRLLSECRAQLEGMERKSEALLARIARLRERGEFDEAIELLEGQPGTSEPGSKFALLLAEIRAESRRKQERESALAASAKAVESRNFAAAIAEIEKVQRAWGESAELAAAIKEIENRRNHYAVETVTKAVEQARAALVDNNSAEAHNLLAAVTEQVEFAGPALIADWKRLGKEAAKKPTTQPEKQKMALPELGSQRRGGRMGLVFGGILAAALIGGGIWYFTRSHQPATANNNGPATQSSASQASAVTQAKSAPAATIVIQGSPGEANVFVDNVPTDFTKSDGSLRLTVSPGSHAIRFSKSGYVDSTASKVTLAENDQRALRYDLAASKTPAAPDTTAYLSIHSMPGGVSVFVDGAQRGETDGQGALMVQVKPGSYALKLARSGFQDSNQNISVTAGEHSTVAVSLNPIVVAKANPPMVVFGASSTQIVQGQSTTLNWNTSNAAEVSIEPGLNRVEANGQTTVNPQSTTTYTLTAKGEGGSVQKAVSIEVSPPKVAVAAPAPAAAPAAVDPKPAIQAALNSFYAAFNAHDIAKMRAVWSGMSDQTAKSYDKTFKDQPKMSAVQNCPSGALDVSGDAADWACSETTTIDSGGKPMLTSHSVRFHFAKQGNDWKITERR